MAGCRVDYLRVPHPFPGLLAVVVTYLPTPLLHSVIIPPSLKSRSFPSLLGWLYSGRSLQFVKISQHQLHPTCRIRRYEGRAGSVLEPLLFAVYCSPAADIRPYRSPWGTVPPVQSYRYHPTSGHLQPLLECLPTAPIWWRCPW